MRSPLCPQGSECLEGLSSFSGVPCCYRPPAGAELFQGGGAAGCLSLSCPGGICLGASCQGLPLRSADGRQSLGGKWKLGCGSGEHRGLGSAVQASFLSGPLGMRTSCAVLSSWAPSWAPSLGSYRVLWTVACGCTSCWVKRRASR